MAITASTIWKVRPGKTQDCFTNITSAKKILEKLGAKCRLLAQGVGTNAPAFIFIVESADWKAYGDLQTKMQTDADWQGFLTKAVTANTNPAADLIGTGLSSEVPLG